jgi:uncharacterized protein
MNPEPDLSSICISCGMCCDGTLFSRAKIWNDEDEQLAKSLDLDVFTHTDEVKYFKLPCHHFKSCCTIYDQPRPITCSKFFCVPLKKCNAGELTFEKANEIINLTVKLRNEIRELAALNSHYRNANIAALLKEFDAQEPSEQLKKYPQLLIKLVAFRVLLIQFRKAE